MAPNLKPGQHDRIRQLIATKYFTNEEIRQDVGCSLRTIQTIRSNLQCFGTTTVRHNRGGRRPIVTADMQQALLARLQKDPDLTLSEMVAYLHTTFQVDITESAVGKILKRIRWSRKVMRRVAQGQSPELRDWYMHVISEFTSNQLVFVDESGCDKKTGYRRTGWSPRGVTPVKEVPLPRGPRYQILPTYGQDGIIYARVLQGNIDAHVFGDFIQYVLQHHCRPWPEDHSVLVMDNASFHRTREIEDMCRRAGVKLIFLPPYSPDFNPIEEFFAELKLFIKLNFRVFEEHPESDFGVFLDWCVNSVGRKRTSARGHFRNAGLVIHNE